MYASKISALALFYGCAVAQTSVVTVLLPLLESGTYYASVAGGDASMTTYVVSMPTSPITLIEGPGTLSYHAVDDSQTIEGQCTWNAAITGTCLYSVTGGPRSGASSLNLRPTDFANWQEKLTITAGSANAAAQTTAAPSATGAAAAAAVRATTSAGTATAVATATSSAAAVPRAVVGGVAGLGAAMVMLAAL